MERRQDLRTQNIADQAQEPVAKGRAVKPVEVLMEVREVTEWKNGAVYKTVLIGERWIDRSEPVPEGIIYSHLSAERVRHMNVCEYIRVKQAN